MIEKFAEKLLDSLYCRTLPDLDSYNNENLTGLEIFTDRLTREVDYGTEAFR